MEALALVLRALVLVGGLGAGGAAIWMVVRSSRKPVPSSRGLDRGAGLLAEGRDAVAAPSPTHLVLGALDSPLLIIGETPAALLPRRHSIAVGPRMRRALGPLAQHAPRLAVAGLEASRRTVEIVLSPELQQRVAEGSAELVRSRELPGALRGMVADKSSRKFIGHASLVDGIDPAMLAAAAWQIAAVVTSQKYLAEINAKLERIDAGVRRIEQWLKDELLSEIEADFSHLQRMAPAVLAGELSDTDRAAYAGTLESIERSNGRAMRLIERTLGGIPTELAARGGFAWSGSGLRENLAAIGADAARYDQLLEGYAAAAWVRLAAARLRLALGMNQGHALAIAKDVCCEVAALGAVHPTAVHDLLTEKSKAMLGMFTWTETDNGAKAQVADLARAAMAHAPRLGAAFSDGQNLGLEVAEMERARGTPLRVYVTVDAKGEMVSVERGVA